MPQAIARQLDRCDVCGQKIHRRELVLTQVDFLAVGGSNYFNYSSYDSSWWVKEIGTDAGTISAGPYADRARVVIGDDNTRTESFGTQTWTVVDVGGTYEGVFLMRTPAIDVSGWTSFVMSYDFGFYERDTTDHRVMVYSYIRDGSENSSGVLTRFTGVRASGRYWWTANIADIDSDVDLTDARFYVTFATYTGGENVWVDRLQLEKDVTKMGAFIPTSGSTVDRVDTAMMTTRKVCPRCRERVLSRSDRYGQIAEIRDEGPVTVAMQEI